jgi:hypothetical protein
LAHHGVVIHPNHSGPAFAKLRQNRLACGSCGVLHWLQAFKKNWALALIKQAPCAIFFDKPHSSSDSPPCFTLALDD